MLAMRRITGSLLQPITHPNLNIFILLLANPIVLLTFTRALLLILIGLSVTILVSTPGCYYFISLVPDTMYICIDFTARLAQFTSVSTDMFSMIHLFTSLVFDTVYSCCHAVYAVIFALAHGVVQSCIHLFHFFYWSLTQFILASLTGR